MKADTTLRPLTVNESKTNKAWDIFMSMSPISKFEMSEKFKEIANMNKRQNAILNYIEDNIDELEL